MSRNSFKAVSRVVGFIGVGRVDPLICPHCNGEMKLILLIDEHCIIEPILRHLGLWHESESVRTPPSKSVGTALVYEPYFSQSGTNIGNVGIRHLYGLIADHINSIIRKT